MTTADLGRFLISASEIFTTQYEKDFEFTDIHHWIANNWSVPIISLIAYAIFCYFGQIYLNDKKPFDLRLSLAAWNAFLSIFSFIGMWRTVPYLLGELLLMSYQDSVCTKVQLTHANGPVGFWTAVFILSKLPELIDTVFIVLRKRELIFLHWYHHITVLLYCWHAYSTQASAGIYFVAMNYSVHAFMYGYFCLQALKMVPKNFPAYLITIAQITQMFVGTGVCASCWYFRVSGISCHNDINNLYAGGAMYASYLYLFVEFAVKKFIPSGKGKKGEKKLE